MYGVMVKTQEVLVVEQHQIEAHGEHQLLVLPVAQLRQERWRHPKKADWGRIVVGWVGEHGSAIAAVATRGAAAVYRRKYESMRWLSSA